MANLEKIPTGLGGELEKDKETLPAMEVENEVFWVNPNLETPFNLKVGDRTGLGLFLTPVNENRGRRLEVGGTHGRSAILGRVVMKAADTGDLFRDIDLKGIGCIAQDKRYIGIQDIALPPRAQEPHIDDKEGLNLGILDLAAAKHDQEMADFFARSGVRCHRVVAIIVLDEIVDKNGSLISVDKAKSAGLVKQEVTPSISVRAMGVKTRQVDTDVNVGGKDRYEAMFRLFEDGRLMVAQELGLTFNEFSKFAYVKWLSRATGRNLGLIHKLGFIHGYPTLHNLTLDGRIVDFDSVRKSTDKTEMEKEMKECRNIVWYFPSYATEIELWGPGYKNWGPEREKKDEIENQLIAECKKEFDEGYQEGLNS